MDVNLWTGFAFVKMVKTFELAILLRDVNHLTWCFSCKMSARLWMRHTHENEVCSCEPVNRVRSCLQNAFSWMQCTCVNGTGETYKCVRICKTRARLWMEKRLCEGELAVENRATYLLTGHLRCECDLIPMKWTSHFWTKPVDYQFTNEGPIHTWRYIHTRMYRLHVEDHGQPIPNLWTGSLRVTGSSTCEWDMYVWTGPVLVKDPPCVNETSTCEWNEMSTCEWILDIRLKFSRWFLHVLTSHKENYTCHLKLNLFFFFFFFFLCVC